VVLSLVVQLHRANPAGGEPDAADKRAPDARLHPDGSPAEQALRHQGRHGPTGHLPQVGVHVSKTRKARIFENIIISINPATFVML